MMVNTTTNVMDHASPQQKGTSNGPQGAVTVSDFVIKQLALWGVKRIYGVLGDANLPFLDAIARQNQIQYVPALTENAAALMASAESKLTGRLAVCTATSGPGVANLLNGLADAYTDGASVLAITGQVSSDKLGTNTKQYVDQQRLVSPVAGYTTLLANAEALPDVMKKAMTLSLAQGTVSHISIPKDVFTLPVQGQPYSYEDHLHQSIHTPPKVIGQAAQLLKTAKKPMILIGRGVKNVPQLVVQLAEKWCAGVMTTEPAKRFFPNDHALYSGGLGQAGSEAATELLKESDLVLILGATWWPDEYVPNQIRIVQIDQAATNIGMGRSVNMGVVGDIAQILPLLLQDIPAEHRQGWSERVQSANQQWKKRIEKEANQDTIPIAPQRAVHALSNTVADDAILTVDTGDHTLWFNRIFQNRNQEVLISGTWRTIGFGLPAAIAAKLEYPNRQVVALVGDGGVVQTLTDFVTAVRQNLPITVVIMNNGKYAMETNRMKVEGLKEDGSHLMNPDFAAIAEACGGVGYRVNRADELDAMLKEALASDKPVILDVAVNDTIVPHTQI
jgi:pyruvate oxidase